jgi:hypothetical protein
MLVIEKGPNRLHDWYMVTKWIIPLNEKKIMFIEMGNGLL